MRFAALISGGKDSCYNIFQSMQHGHVLTCLIHLIPPNSGTSMEESNSFMYQTAGSGVVTAYSDCFGVEIIQHVITGSSLRTSLEYIDEEVGDEVEDLYQAILTAKMKYPEIEGIACGAILSNYQRNRVENVCQRLNLRVISYLWQRDQQELLNEMLFTHHMQIILVKVAGAGLDPYKHLNKDLSGLYSTLVSLHGKYGLDLCGEGGEYESLVLDAPFFYKKIIIDETEVIIDSNDPSVGNLLIKAWHLETKDKIFPTATLLPQRMTESLQSYLPTTSEGPVNDEAKAAVRMKILPRFVVDRNGFGVTPLLTAPPTVKTEPETAQTQLISIINLLIQGLHAIQVELKDVIYVHLYLRDMTDFTAVNDIYCQYFGYNPPSRSCIMIKSSSSSSLSCWHHVALSATYVKGSYAAACSTIPSPLLNHHHIRQVLHVRSLSQWAPLCIGPYSQANTIHHFLSFIAGQIPLDPATMTLRPWSNTADITAGSNDFVQEMSLDIILCMRHISRILSVLGSDNQHLLSLVLFVNDSVFPTSSQEQDSNMYHNQYAEIIHRCCRTMKAAAATKLTKKVDFNAVDEMDESELAEYGSNDLESSAILPSLIIVNVPNLPRDAPVEIEAIGYRRNHICEEKWQSFNGPWSLIVSSATVSCGAEQVATVTGDSICSWSLWMPAGEDSSVTPSSSSLLSVHVRAKWYPETIFSGAITLMQSQPWVDSQPSDHNSGISLHAVVESTLQAIQELLEKAKMRWQQVKIIKVYYSASLLLVHSYELQTVFAQCMPTAEAKNVSVVIIPCLTVENNALLTAHIMGVDLQQVETEAWVNMRD